MTDLQKTRKALMNQLKKIENGTSTDKEIESVVMVSNSIIKSLNVEVRADELAQDKNATIKNEVFKDESDL